MPRIPNHMRIRMIGMGELLSLGAPEPHKSAISNPICEIAVMHRAGPGCFAGKLLMMLIYPVGGKEAWHTGHACPLP